MHTNFSFVHNKMIRFGLVRFYMLVDRLWNSLHSWCSCKKECFFIHIHKTPENGKFNEVYAFTCSFSFWRNILIQSNFSVTAQKSFASEMLIFLKSSTPALQLYNYMYCTLVKFEFEFIVLYNLIRSKTKFTFIHI